MEQSRKRISVIVLDYCGQRFWKALIQALSIQVYRNFEVIVVDNGGSLELPENSIGLEIKIIRAEGNLGFAAGCNLGAQNAIGEFLVFLNNDVELTDEWLESLMRRVETDSSIGAIVSKVVFFPRYVRLSVFSPVFNPSNLGASADDRDLGVRIRFDSCWSESTGRLKESGFHGSEWIDGEEWRWTDKCAEIWLPTVSRDEGKLTVTIDTPIELLGKTARIVLGGHERNLPIDGQVHGLFFSIDPNDFFDVINSAGSVLSDDGTSLERGIYEFDEGQYEASEEVTAFSGCSVMVRKDVFEELGGFDPAFFAYYEDTDLSWRIRKAGWKIVYEPKSIVRHHRSGTSGEQSPFFCFHIYRNFRWNVAKNARWGTALTLLFRECCCWIPSNVSANREFSPMRLKRETILGMLKYLGKRLMGILR